MPLWPQKNRRIGALEVIRRLVQSAVLLLGVLVMGMPSVAYAQAAMPEMRMGTFDGQRGGDKAKFTIDMANPDGTLVGSTKLIDGINKGYVITFTGKLATDGSIALSRTDKYPTGSAKGKTIQQRSSASAVELIAQTYVCKGVTTGQGLPAGQIFDFELRLPVEVRENTPKYLEQATKNISPVLDNARKDGYRLQKGTSLAGGWIDQGVHMDSDAPL